MANWADFSHDGHIAVTDIQLGRPINEVDVLLSVGVMDINLNKIVTKLPILFIGEDVEEVGFGNDVLDGADFLFVIIIYLKLGLAIDKEHILGRDNYEFGLIFVEDAKERLILKCVFHLI